MNTVIATHKLDKSFLEGTFIINSIDVENNRSFFEDIVSHKKKITIICGTQIFENALSIDYQSKPRVYRTRFSKELKLYFLEEFKSAYRLNVENKIELFPEVDTTIDFLDTNKDLFWVIRDSMPVCIQQEDVSSTKITQLNVLNQPLQQIYYGAPGTGKSHATNDVTSKYPDTVRTTFHPDSDYSTFVGAYKPTMSNPQKRYELDGNHKVFAMQYPEGDSKTGFICETKIEYKFVKQSFLKAYVKAWKLFKETCVEGGELAPQFLVIEEINRGNCAQIFGDLFQLLDRKQNFSEYPIEADDDIRKALLEEDIKENPSFGENGLQLTPEQMSYVNQVFDKEGEPSRGVAEKICNGQVLVLPPNLYIWATMNTSDQSLFPIDSAFKRRWEWKYVRINEGKDKETGLPLNFRIKFNVSDSEKVDESWWDFIQKINEKIEVATKSEDKKLGYFFCKPDKKANETDKENTIISAETFVGKVVFYLWQDVFKDYGFKSDIFKKEGNARLAFHDFYPHNIEPDEEKNPEGIDLKLVQRFIDKVMDRKPTETQTEAPVTPANE